MNSSRRHFNRTSFDEENPRCRGLAGLTWISFWLFVLFWMFLPPAIQTITIYRLNCPDALATGDSCQLPKVPITTTYRVFIDEQFVINKTTMARYEDCAIFDRGNWECRTPQTTIRLRKGRELFLARREGYTAANAYDEASETLANEAHRSPQVPFWTWFYYEANNRLGTMNLKNRRQDQ